MKKIIRFIEVHSLTFFNLLNLLLIPILLMLDYDSDMIIINIDIFAGKYCCAIMHII